MIHYQLQCDQSHQFDGWFPSSAGFEEQARRGLVECPHCASTRVERALMAPAVPRKSNSKPDKPAAAKRNKADVPAVASNSAAEAALPAEVRAALQRVRAEIEAHCEHVGDRFADEARAIHKGEKPVRGIYGQATEEQAEALADEGIEVARIPWLPRSDA